MEYVIFRGRRLKGLGLRVRYFNLVKKSEFLPSDYEIYGGGGGDRSIGGERGERISGALYEGLNANLNKTSILKMHRAINNAIDSTGNLPTTPFYVDLLVNYLSYFKTLIEENNLDPNLVTLYTNNYFMRPSVDVSGLRINNLKYNMSMTTEIGDINRGVLKNGVPFISLIDENGTENVSTILTSQYLEIAKPALREMFVSEKFITSLASTLYSGRPSQLFEEIPLSWALKTTTWVGETAGFLYINGVTYVNGYFYKEGHEEPISVQDIDIVKLLGNISTQSPALRYVRIRPLDDVRIAPSGETEVGENALLADYFAQRKTQIPYLKIRGFDYAISLSSGTSSSMVIGFTEPDIDSSTVAENVALTPEIATKIKEFIDAAASIMRNNYSTTAHYTLRVLREVLDRKIIRKDLQDRLEFGVCEWSGLTTLIKPQFNSYDSLYSKVNGVVAGFTEHKILSNVNATVTSRGKKVMKKHSGEYEKRSKDFKHKNVLEEFDASSGVNNYSFNPSSMHLKALVKGSEDTLVDVVDIYEVEEDTILMGIEFEFDRIINSPIVLSKGEVVELSTNTLTKGLPAFYATSDGSLYDGFEIKSVPVDSRLVTQDGVFEWKDFFESLLALGYNGENNTCGLHIHINKNYFDLPNVPREDTLEFVNASMMHIMDNNKDYLLNLSRREYSKMQEWARIHPTHTKDFVKEFDLLNGGYNIYKRWTSRMIALNSARYSAFNIRKSPTYEFRLFRGVDSVEDFNETIKFTLDLVKRVKAWWVAFNENVTWDKRVDVLSEISTFKFD